MTSVMNITETPKKSYSAKYYNNKIKTDAEFYEKEKKRGYVIISTIDISMTQNIGKRFYNRKKSII